MEALLKRIFNVVVRSGEKSLSTGFEHFRFLRARRSKAEGYSTSVK
jgi:hypothetical protein